MNKPKIIKQDKDGALEKYEAEYPGVGPVLSGKHHHAAVAVLKKLLKKNDRAAQALDKLYEAGKMGEIFYIAQTPVTATYTALTLAFQMQEDGEI